MADPRIFAASDEGLALSIPRLLFAVLGPPVLWAIHLGTCYFLVTLDCISGWGGGVWSVLAATAVAAGATVAAGLIARSMWRRAGGDRIRPAEREWRRFLLVGGMAGSILFTLVILATGAAPLFVDTCA